MTDSDELQLQQSKHMLATRVSESFYDELSHWAAYRQLSMSSATRILIREALDQHQSRTK